MTTTTEMVTAVALAEKRRQLAEAKIALRAAEADEKCVRATVENTAIEGAEAAAPNGTKPGTAIGTNEADRKRNLQLALDGSDYYGEAYTRLWVAQDAVDRLTAECEGMVDVLRERRLVSQDRYSDALLALAAVGATLSVEERAGVPSNVEVVVEERAGVPF